MSHSHYLKTELEALFSKDPSMFRFLQGGSLDGVWYWDLEQPQHEWMSPEFWRLFGIDPATKKHDPDEWQDIIHPTDLKLALENFNAHCADPDHPYDQIVRYKHVDGSTVWVRCRGIAIRDETGKPIRMLGAHNDLTAIKEAEQQAQKKAEIAEHANEELKRFAYSISHDLKSPANTIKLVIGELQEQLSDSSDQDVKHLLDISTKTIDRMAQLIEEVLEYTRALNEDIQKTSVNVDTLITEVIKDLAADIETRAAKISVNELGCIHGMDIQMRLLFSNLLSNAIKFTPEGRTPEIKIYCQNTSASYVQFVIEDNGLGIAPEHQDKIFQMFERLHTRNEFEGSGLGLALCQRIAFNHGGKITVESELGTGSKFIIHLPQQDITNDKN